MTIRGVCPDCGGVRPLSEFLDAVRERQALDAALRMDPRMADGLLEYLDLFSPPGKKLQNRKLLRLLTELQELMSAGEVKAKDGRCWPAPLEYWRTALEDVSARRAGLTLPLNGHGYLQTVVVGIATKVGAKKETKREQSRANRPSTGSGELTQVGEVVARAAPKVTPPPGDWKEQCFKQPREKGGEQ